MNSSLQMEIRITEMLMLNEIRKLKAYTAAANEIIDMYEHKLTMLKGAAAAERRLQEKD